MTTNTLTVDSLQNELATLGTNADEIAQSFRDSNIQGRVGEETECPVANWLAYKYPGEFVFVKPEEIAVDGVRLVLDLSDDPVSAFIQKFDNYDYADLIADEYDEDQDHNTDDYYDDEDD